MRFPNAAAGVKKIFTAEILSLIASVAGLLSTVLMVVTLVLVGNGSEGGALASGAGTLILGLGVLVLSIIAFIMNIVGISQASKDESSFKMAMLWLIIGIIASVLVGVFSTNGVVQSIAQTVSQVMQLAVTIFVIQGIVKLADRLNRGDISAKGSNLFKVLLVIYLLILIADIVVMIFGGIAASITAAVLASVAGVLSVVQYFMYLSFLAKSKKMLAEGK